MNPEDANGYVAHSARCFTVWLLLQDIHFFCVCIYSKLCLRMKTKCNFYSSRVFT
jgi:hypothetical protein